MTKHYKLNRVLGLFFLLPFVLLAVLRYPGLTPDTYTYFEYTEIIYKNLILPVEPFHYYLTLFFRSLGLVPDIATRFVFATYIFLSFFFIHSFYKRFNLNTSLMMFLYVCTSYTYLNLVQMRWGLSVAIILYSIHFLYKSRLKFFIFLILASLVHFSSIIFLPIILFKSTTFNIYKMISLPLVSLIGLFFFDIFDLFMDFSNLFLGDSFSIFSSIVAKLKFYLARSGQRDNLFNAFSAFFVFTFTSLLFLKSRNKDFDPIINVSVKTLVYGISLFLLFRDIPIISRRIMLAIVPLTIPLSVYFFRNTNAKTLGNLILIIYGLFVFINIGFIHGLIRI